jgi:hypothetical protein
MTATDTEILRQCGRCLKFCDDQGWNLDPQPVLKRLVIPEIVLCLSCSLAPPGAIAPVNVSPPPGTVPAPRRASQARRRAWESSGIDRSQPPETDFQSAVHVIPTPAHAEAQRDFETSNPAHDQVAMIQARLFDGFDGVKPGPWVDGWTLFKLDNIKAVNSRAADIRRELKPRGLDVDTAMIPSPNGKSYWAYRICRVEDSLRLKRERERAE